MLDRPKSPPPLLQSPPQTQQDPNLIPLQFSPIAPPAAKQQIPHTRIEYKNFEPSLVETMWRNRSDLVKNLIISLSFLLALALHSIVSESLPQDNTKYLYPAIVLLVIWVLRASA